MTLTLPETIKGYFASDQSGNLDLFLRHFAPNAVVMDERRTYRGHAAIRQWKSQAAAQYTYRAEPFALAEQDGQIIVTARLTGDFPGSPVDLRYRFTLEGAAIAVLEIAP